MAILDTTLTKSQAESVYREQIKTAKSVIYLKGWE